VQREQQTKVFDDDAHCASSLPHCAKIARSLPARS
jgi:hypothetical protein